MCTVLPSHSHSSDADFARIISRKFAHGRFLILGANFRELERHFTEVKRDAVVRWSSSDLMMKLGQGMNRIGLHALTRFLPIPDLAIMPKDLTREQLREWVVLDTFDMLSPEYDNPQRIGTVARMFERSGAEVTFAGFVDNGTGRAAVVRAVKRGR